MKEYRQEWKRIVNTIVKGEKHEWKEEVVALSEDYVMMRTGKGQDEYIETLFPSEGVDARAQRRLLTNPETVGALRIVANAFEKIKRVKPSVFAVKVEDDEDGKDQEKILKSLRNWNRTGIGLSEWILKNIYEDNEIDPNMSYVLNVREYDPSKDVIPFYLYKAGSNQIMNWKKWGDFFDWVVISEQGYYFDEDYVNEPKYIYYGKETRIELEKIPPLRDGKEQHPLRKEAVEKLADLVIDSTYPSVKINSNKGEEFIYLSLSENGGHDYRVSITQHEIGYAPVFSVGYIGHKNFGEGYFVNIFHDGLPTLKDMIDNNSEHSVVGKQTTHPVLTMMIPKCKPHETTNKIVNCQEGRDPKDFGSYCELSHCRTCHNRKYTTLMNLGTQQYRIYEYSSSDPSQAKDIDIKNTMMWSPIPEKSMNRLTENADRLMKRLYVIVTGTEDYMKKSVGPTTATESLINLDVRYDILYAIISHAFKLTRYIAKTNAAMMGIDPDTVHVTISVPESILELSLKEAIEVRKNALEAGISSSSLERISYQLIDKLFEDNPTEAMRLKAWQRILPMLNKTMEYKQFVIGLSNIPDSGIPKIEAFLIQGYLLVKDIVERRYRKDGEERNPFYEKTLEEQRSIVEDVALKLMEEMEGKGLYGVSEKESGNLQLA